MPSAADSNVSLLVFSDDWGRHPSSCQHLVRRLLPSCNILWVNSIGTREVRADGFTLRRGVEKIKSWGRGLRHVAERMWVVDAPMLPSVGGRCARWLNRRLVTSNIRWRLKQLRMASPVVVTTLPHVSWLLGDVGQRGLVYYCTDDYSFWPSANGAALREAESDLLARADVVLGVSQALCQRFSRSSRCHYFPHAVDFEHFAAVPVRAPHPLLQSMPRPRIGFFGLIYEKLDFALLQAVAQACPQAHLVMIGPVAYCPASLRQLPNVHFSGPQPYESLPEWIAGLDVLLLPYVRDEMIWQSNPLKLRECLASGTPTVSIDLPEARVYAPHVYLAANADAFIDNVRAALSETRDRRRREERQEAVRGERWEARAKDLLGYVSELRGHYHQPHHP